MTNKLKTEIGTLQKAITNLAKNRDHKSKMELFVIFVRLRLLYGYNVYAELDNRKGYALLNENKHDWIFIAERHSRILNNKDFNYGTSTFKQFCNLGDGKCNSPKGGRPAPPVPMGWAQGVNASDRISLSWQDYSSLRRFLKEFMTFDERGLDIKFLRKEKLNKLFNQ